MPTIVLLGGHECLKTQAGKGSQEVLHSVWLVLLSHKDNHHAVSKTHVICVAWEWFPMTHFLRESWFSDKGGIKIFSEKESYPLLLPRVMLSFYSGKNFWHSFIVLRQITNSKKQVEFSSEKEKEGDERPKIKRMCVLEKNMGSPRLECCTGEKKVTPRDKMQLISEWSVQGTVLGRHLHAFAKLPWLKPL